MFDKREVIAFFDSCAGTWDENMIRDDSVIDVLLENAQVKPGIDVLDVACGTGVLFPDYLKRGIRTLTGIDISPEMVKCARAKFSGDPVQILCGDVEEMRLDRRFDLVMVYNAFPHFPDPKRLIKRLSELTKPGGRLSIAHGMSREKINSCHQGAAHRISNGLMPAEELRQLFLPYFDGVQAISNEKMYQVTGIRKEMPLPENKRRSV